jgi:hypothetical protein
MEPLPNGPERDVELARAVVAMGRKATVDGLSHDASCGSVSELDSKTGGIVLEWMRDALLCHRKAGQ